MNKVKNKYYKINIVLLGALLILKIVDIITTIYGLKIKGVKELNPLGFNLFSLILYSSLFLILFISVYLSRNIKIGLIGFIIIISFSIFIGFLVVINNIRIICG